MHTHTKKGLLTITLATTMLIAACGSSKKAADTTAAAETTAAAAETTAAPAETTAAPADTTAAANTGVDLKAAGCPDTVSIQLDWAPETEHGNVYQLVGDGYTFEKDKGRVIGPLVSGGKDTGVKIEVRSGGAAISYNPVTAEVYKDPDILLAFVATDDAISSSGDQPMVSLLAPFQKNPQVILWDPATYPNVKTVADAGATGAKLRVFPNSAYTKWLVSAGLFKQSQIDESYTGAPTEFVADEGKSLSQGFSSSEPYIWQYEVKEWGKPVSYAYLDDAGWRTYAQTIGTRAEYVTKYASCFKALIPLFQKSAVEFVADPTHANKVLIDANTAYDNGWVYDAATAKYGAGIIAKDKLLGNGPDGVLGSFDEKRIADFMAIAEPIYKAVGSKVKDGLKPTDLYDPQFIDPTIKLP